MQAINIQALDWWDPSAVNLSDWQKCASVTPGGKSFFYVRKITAYGAENWGFDRIVWNREVQAYAATRDQRHGDRPALLGYFSTVKEAQAAFG